MLLVDTLQGFGEIGCFHLQNIRTMESVDSFQTLVSLYQATRRHKSENRNLLTALETSDVAAEESA
jgi:predicted metal-dependent HD superfamily phosphohydrolase